MSAAYDLTIRRERQGLDAYLKDIWEQRDPHGKWIKPQGKWPIQRSVILRMPKRSARPTPSKS